MSLGAYQAIAAIVGGTQQKSSQLSHDKQISKIVTGHAPNREGHADSFLTSKTSERDNASITRAAIVALQSTPATGDESVIRDDRMAQEALAYSQSQIKEQPEMATATQANQTSQQLLALYSG